MSANTQKIMLWVDALPGVVDTDLPARRDEIAAMMTEAQQFEAEAAELVRKAQDMRSKAYFAACSLEGDARGRWTFQQVEDAKRYA